MMSHCYPERIYGIDRSRFMLYGHHDFWWRGAVQQVCACSGKPLKVGF